VRLVFCGHEKMFLYVAMMVVMTWNSNTNATHFPEDLMYNEKPIRACCMLEAFEGDSSRFSPKSLCCAGHRSSKVIKEEHEFDSKTNTVCFRCHYQGRFGESVSFKEYTYIGSWRHKHLISTCHYDHSGTGRFTGINLVEREGDTIINAGEIAGGDRGYGGSIKIESLKGSILRYRQIEPPNHVIYKIIGRSDDAAFFPVPYRSGVYLIYEVDLDSVYVNLACKIGLDPEIRAKYYRSRLVGVRFDSDCESVDNWGMGFALKNFERCFYAVVARYVASGRQELDISEAGVFADAVWDGYRRRY
jgi:hypothetical protein